MVCVLSNQNVGKGDAFIAPEYENTVSSIIINAKAKNITNTSVLTEVLFSNEKVHQCE